MPERIFRDRFSKAGARKPEQPSIRKFELDLPKLAAHLGLPRDSSSGIIVAAAFQKRIALDHEIYSLSNVHSLSPYQKQRLEGFRGQRDMLNSLLHPDEAGR